MGRLSNKVAIITGGASGMGAATAKRFVDEGAHVIIADLQVDKGNELAASLGNNATFIATDVGREADVIAMIDVASSRHGRLDCLFNNAGFGGFVDRPHSWNEARGSYHARATRRQHYFNGQRSGYAR